MSRTGAPTAQRRTTLQPLGYGAIALLTVALVALAVSALEYHWW